MWPTQTEVRKTFGNPSNKDWATKNLIYIKPPFKMQMGELAINNIRVHKIAAPSLARVLTRIWDVCGHDQAKLNATHCNCYSGCWNVRPIRGKTTPSMHSYGLAIDIDAPHNPLGAADAKCFFKKKGGVVVDAFKAEGWIWGGDWTGRRDAMHFQAAIVE